MSASRNGYIGRAPADSSVIIARKTYEPTGVQTDFTFAAGYTPGYCDVYINGVKLIDATDYSATNGSTVGLTSAAASGDVVEVVAYKAFNLGIPVSNITGNLDITGNISASSSITVDSGFYGDGSNLSGVAGAAITQYISANSLAVLGSPGVSTITRLGATDLNVTGIITANGLSGNVTGAACTFTTGTFNGNVTIGGTLTYEDVTNVDALGIITARAGVNVSGGEFKVGTALTIGSAGVATFIAPAGVGVTITPATGKIEATTYYGDGSNLSGITGTTINSNADNRLITGSGTAGTLNGESNLTFDGSTLGVTGAITASGAVNVDATTASTSTSTGALIVDGGVGIAKDLFVGDSIDVTKDLKVGAATTITGALTATSGHITGGGEFKVGTALTVASTSGVATFSNDVTFKDAGYQGIKFENSGVKFSDQDVFFVGDNQTIKWIHDGNCIRWEDSAEAQWGTGQDLRIAHNGTEGTFNITTGDLIFKYSNQETFRIGDTGVKITGIATVTEGLNTDGLLSEKFETVANKLSAAPNIDLEDGMVHYFTTTESTTSTPNIRYSSSKTLNNMLSTGDAITVTIITTAAAAGYSASWEIDGTGITEEWVGGSAPSEGGSDGYDIYTANILKTGNAAFKVFINLVNAT